MGEKKIIFLDNNATTKVKDAVAETIFAVLKQTPLNASSVHESGRNAKKIIDAAKEKVTKAAGATSAEIVFTASGTEANNLAIKGVHGFIPVVSAIEHLSVLKPAESKDAHLIPVDKNGIVDVKTLEKILESLKGKALVSVMLANNETGIIQPIREITELVHKKGGIMHTDAVQALGKIEVNFENLGVDLMTVSSHKFGGATGAAALIVKKGTPLKADITGGGQQLGLRAGSENVAAIAGFGIAAELISEDLKKAKEVKNLKDHLEIEIKKLSELVKVYGADVERLPNTSLITMPEVTAETQLINFDLAGIMVSSGSACTSGKIDVSHVLQAMAANKEEAVSAIRVSLGLETTKEEIDAFIKEWKQLYFRSVTNRGKTKAA